MLEPHLSRRIYSVLSLWCFFFCMSTDIFLYFEDIIYKYCLHNDVDHILLRLLIFVLFVCLFIYRLWVILVFVSYTSSSSVFLFYDYGLFVYFSTSRSDR